MNKENIEILKKDIEEIITTHKDVLIEVNRTQPHVVWENGVPENVPTWITLTITITSKYYYVPDGWSAPEA